MTPENGQLPASVEQALQRLGERERDDGAAGAAGASGPWIRRGLLAVRVGTEIPEREADFEWQSTPLTVRAG